MVSRSAEISIVLLPIASSAAESLRLDAVNIIDAVKELGERKGLAASLSLVEATNHSSPIKSTVSLCKVPEKESK